MMIASGGQFLTHDSISRICNKYSEQMSLELQHVFQKNVGCIKIGDNVFIGVDSLLCSNVRIGKISIVTADLVVVKAVPEGTGVRGNLAKVVCKFEDSSSISVGALGINARREIKTNIKAVYDTDKYRAN